MKKWVTLGFTVKFYFARLKFKTLKWKVKYLLTPGLVSVCYSVVNWVHMIYLEFYINISQLSVLGIVSPYMLLCPYSEHFTSEI